MRTELADEPISVARFTAGRDLAVAMLRRCSEVTLIERAALEARERTDPTAPQHRWVLPFLVELQRDPGLLDGFSAVLSDYLASGTGGSPEHYVRVSASMLTDFGDARG
jgi:hypothetical protein